MTLTIPEDVRAKAEIYVGDAAGQEKTRLLLEETGLPSGLLPLRDIIECGYVEETGFVWLRQRRKVDHYFAKAGRHVSYAAEVSAVAEQGRLKKITGVKAKEMLIWVTLHEICLDDVASNSEVGSGKGKLVCKAMGGLSRSFPVDAFEAEGVPPTAGKRPAADGGGVVVGAKLKPAAVGVAAEKKEEPAAEDNKKMEDVKEEEKKPEQKEGEAADKNESVGEAGDKAKEEAEGKSKDDTAAAAIDAVEEKLKELSTEAPPVHAEAVSAKN